MSEIHIHEQLASLSTSMEYIKNNLNDINTRLREVELFMSQKSGSNFWPLIGVVLLQVFTVTTTCISMFGLHLTK